MNKHFSFSSLPIAALLLFASCTGGGGHDDGKMAEHMAMMKADSAAKANEATCIACFEKIFAMLGSGDATGIEDCVSENFTERSTPPPGITSTGVQYVKDIIAWNHAAFPDMKMTIISSAVKGDMAYVHFNQKGTNTGAMGPDMPATGKAIDLNGVDIVRFENGKAVEHWGYSEEQKMMQQLGLMPPPGEATKN